MHLDSAAMKLDLPEVLESDVHRLSVLELVLKLDALAGHLNADEHADQRLGQRRDLRVSQEELLSLKAAPTTGNMGDFSSFATQY